MTIRGLMLAAVLLGCSDRIATRADASRPPALSSLHALLRCEALP